MDTLGQTWKFKPTKIQQMTNPASGVAGCFLLIAAVLILVSGSAYLNDLLGVWLLSIMTFILGTGLMAANLKYWRTSVNFPPNGYNGGAVINISLKDDNLYYGLQGMEQCKLNRKRIWRIKSGHLGCSSIMTVEYYNFVIPNQVITDPKFQAWLNETGA